MNMTINGVTFTILQSFNFYIGKISDCICFCFVEVV